VEGRIDSDDADGRWAATTDQALQRGELAAAPPARAVEVLPILDGVVEQAPAALSARPVWDVPFPPPVPLRDRGAVATNVIDGDTFIHWRTRAMRADALAAELALAKEQKKSLDTDEVVKAFAGIGRMYANGRESLPSQLAPKLVGLTDLQEIARLIRQAMRESDQRIANQVKAQYSEIVDTPMAKGGD